MIPLLDAAKVITAIGVVGGGALTVDYRYLTRTAFEDFQAATNSAIYLQQLTAMGAHIDRHGNVDCRPVPPQIRGQCIFVRSQFYRAQGRKG
jgi:hypothetical protein